MSDPAATARPSVVAPTRLSDIAAAAQAADLTAVAQVRPAHGGDVLLTGITASSALVRAGDIFAALPGRSGHGARFVTDALAAGAVAVLTDPAGAALVADAVAVPLVVVTDVRAVLGPVSALIYGQPATKLTVIGITGTSGKTTTSFFVRAGLLAAGRRCGLIGTVATMMDNEIVPSMFTTPEAPELQALLAVMVEHGLDSVVMEVSSHALAMRRVDGIGFDIAAFTNLSQDHLDFHHDLDEYFHAKARLFSPELLGDGAAVVMVDDDWGQRLARQLAHPRTVTTAVAVPALYSARDTVVAGTGVARFRAVGPGMDVAAGCRVPGGYNVANAVLALVILDCIGICSSEAAAAVMRTEVPGRMQLIERDAPGSAHDPLVVVDYSHKPAAVAGALTTMRALTSGRVIIVLGCGGDRDHAKRSVMGAVAARQADVLVVTDDNPRSEDPAVIRAEMLEGANSVADAHRARIVEIGDRREAIFTAVALAQFGDTVLIAGKGHETGQETAGKITPFDDRQVAREALEMTPQAPSEASL